MSGRLNARGCDRARIAVRACVVEGRPQHAADLGSERPISCRGALAEELRVSSGEVRADHLAARLLRYRVVGVHLGPPRRPPYLLPGGAAVCRWSVSALDPRAA